MEETSLEEEIETNAEMSCNSTILLIAALVAFSFMFVLIKLFRMYYCSSKRNMDDAAPTGLFLADVANRPCYELIDNTVKAPNCPVCLEMFSSGSGHKCKRLKQCGHAFHVDCVDPWLLKNHHCPLCRADVKNVIPGEEHVAVVMSTSRDSSP